MRVVIATHHTFDGVPDKKILRACQHRRELDDDEASALSKFVKRSASPV
jgi:hypothetical protein